MTVGSTSATPPEEVASDITKANLNLATSPKEATSDITMVDSTPATPAKEVASDTMDVDSMLATSPKEATLDTMTVDSASPEKVNVNETPLPDWFFTLGITKETCEMDIVEKVDGYMAEHYNSNLQDNHLTIEEMKDWITRFHYLLSLMKENHSRIAINQYVQDFQNYIKRYKDHANKTGKYYIVNLFNFTF